MALHSQVEIPDSLETQVMRRVPHSVRTNLMVAFMGEPSINVYASGTMYYLEDTRTGHAIATDLKPVFDKLIEHLFDTT